jgi:putative intracellular protease/amidase
MKEVLFVILEPYADWEAALVAAAISDPEGGEQKYVVKTVSLEKKPVHSIGGFTVLPDYDLASVPEDFAAVLLIGGYSWRKPEAVPIAALVKRARERGALVGAICGATVFLGMQGFLNEARHTSNTLDSLKAAAGERYTGESRYIREQAVSDGGIITANGTAYMEFAREVLIALNGMPQENIDKWYDFYKLGFYEALKKRGKVF